MMPMIPEFDKPIMIFGGVCSNLSALQALKHVAAEQGFAPDHIFNLGDIVAYCSHAEECAEECADWEIHNLLGNCEESLGWEKGDCGCGFGEDSVCSILAVGWYGYALSQVSFGSKAWMRTLPREIRIRMAGKDILFTHGSPDQINEFVFASTPEERKAELLTKHQADIIIGAHAGIPFGQIIPTDDSRHTTVTNTLDQKAWLNCGSLGIPANDGTTDGWYLILSPQNDRIVCEWKRLSYDFQPEKDNMLRQNQQEYADTLSSGLWPSMDILPEKERGMQGKVIELPSMSL